MIRNRKLNRLTGFDYSNEGYYFVTICVKDKTEWFGEIKDGRMMLNKYGKIIKNRWVWLPKQYFYIQFDEFVVMPNHFHGILSIGNGHDNVGNARERSLRKMKSLSELIGAFKTTSSKLIHRTGLLEFQWQKSFYDHIIRNEQDLTRVREYIVNNPLKWEEDEENIKP
jgi:REP element-mobilizing transposase RayT